jgi:hypothetical protein
VQIMSPHFVAQPDGAVVVPHGKEEPEPAPRFRLAREAPPASFDPVEKAAEERARRAAEEAAKAERVRLRAEREAAGETPEELPEELPEETVDEALDPQGPGEDEGDAQASPPGRS